MCLKMTIVHRRDETSEKKTELTQQHFYYKNETENPNNYRLINFTRQCLQDNGKFDREAIMALKDHPQCILNAQNVLRKL